jgi:DNA-directed RNA polymerase subunit RPC12/RpoP
MFREFTNKRIGEDNLLSVYREENLIEDGKHKIITCENCGKELVDIWIVRKDAPVSSDISIECPHCNTTSIVSKLLGQYCVGQIESGCTKMIDFETRVLNETDIVYQEILIKTEKGHINE